MSDPIEVTYGGIDARGTIENLLLWEGGPEFQMNVIQTGNIWGVTLSWEMSGNSLLFPIWSTTRWQVQLFLESIGVHAEYTLPLAGPVLVPWGAILANVRNWNQNVAIPADNPTIDPGPYRLAVMIQLYLGDDPLAITGFIEGPAVVFFNP